MILELEAERGRIKLKMTALRLGQDLSVTLSGGDRPHIGAVALAHPNEATSALTLPQHRESELAQEIASQLATRLNATVCVACGIHLDDILEIEIRDVLDMAQALTQKLGDQLMGLGQVK